ncbi:MAG: YadA-like family protein [Clostridiales bacterium]|nr:YadA-like family protein [Clostridiales bacterium]
MNKKTILTTFVLTAVTASTFAAGLDNTVNPTAAYYGAEAYGYTNTITAAGRSAFVTGYNNTISANNALVYGIENKAEGINSLVGGEYSKATGRNSVAIGSHAEALQDNTFAIGSQARTSGENTVAIGNGAYANGVSSIVLGRTNTVNGDDSVVVGANNGTVSAGQSAVFGYNNQVLDSSKEQLAFGSNNKTKGQGATVLGSHGQAVAVDSLALGNNTLADVQNSVALGTNSTTEEAVSTDHIHINGERYDFAGGVANSTVSIGTNNKAGNGGVKEYKRTLTNVAAGRVDGTSTDAVNGSQLNAVINALKFTTVAEGTNTTVKQTTNIDGGKEFSVHVNKDLVNMNSVNFGTNADTVHSVVNKEKAHFFNGDTNTAVTYNGLKLENTNNLDTASYTMNGMQASSNGKDIRFSTDGISAGGQIINNVKAGVADTDAVNVSQLKRVENILDNKINDVSHNVLERANHYTDLQVNKGVAKASALAGLKFLDYNPKDKWSFAASVGHYRNANAVAVGAAYQPNENTMVHGGITVDGKVAYNLGVSFKTGGQKYINKYELAEQVRQLQSDNTELRQELNELRSMIEKK